MNALRLEPHRRKIAAGLVSVARTLDLDLVAAVSAVLVLGAVGLLFAALVLGLAVRLFLNVSGLGG